MIHHPKRPVKKNDLFWPKDAQVARLEPHFPKSRCRPRLDDRRMLSGVFIFINRNWLRWRDAPFECGPHITLYKRWKHTNEKGTVAGIMADTAAEHSEEKSVIIDSPYFKTHRTGTSMGVQKGSAAV